MGTKMGVMKRQYYHVNCWTTKEELYKSIQLFPVVLRKGESWTGSQQGPLSSRFKGFRSQARPFVFVTFKPGISQCINTIKGCPNEQQLLCDYRWWEFVCLTKTESIARVTHWRKLTQGRVPLGSPLDNRLLLFDNFIDECSLNNTGSRLYISERDEQPEAPKNVWAGNNIPIQCIFSVLQEGSLESVTMVRHCRGAGTCRRKPKIQKFGNNESNLRSALR